MPLSLGPFNLCRIRMLHKQIIFRKIKKTLRKKWLFGLNRLMCQRPSYHRSHIHITILSAHHRLSHFKFFCSLLFHSSPYLHVRDFLLDELLLLNSNECQIGARGTVMNWSDVSSALIVTDTQRMIFGYIIFLRKIISGI